MASHEHEQENSQFQIRDLQNQNDILRRENEKLMTAKAKIQSNLNEVQAVLWSTEENLGIERRKNRNLERKVNDLINKLHKEEIKLQQYQSDQK